ncbi:CMD domain-containing protein [Aminobacter sp. LjRoot7]|uniref:CMD domain-containing protein n=1 Tax=Aminobacter sp. LjRoot7 TaxID=3342335 RepID=UPI003ECEECA1
MTDTKDVIAAIVGIEPGSELAAVVAGRADIMALTQQTHDAALTPAEPGGLTHAERAALACRIAKINDAGDFEAHFEALLDSSGATGDTARIADIWFDGGSDIRLKALIRHVDLVAHAPKDATRRDIELLREAGLDDADIVRLSELVAFVSYQIRVAAGLRLMRGLA